MTLDQFSPALAAQLQHYLEHSPPLPACFDADGTLWRGDAGDDFLFYLIRQRVLPDVWPEYQRLLSLDPAEAYAYATRALAGLLESEVEDLCAQFWREHPPAVFPAVLRLALDLQARQHPVWIVSGSNRWVIQAAARVLGLSPERVLAQAVAVQDGRLSAQDLPPHLFGAGKVVAIQAALPRLPGIALGNSWSDAQMLDAATSLRILVNPTRLVSGERDLVSHAKARGWWIEDGS